MANELKTTIRDCIHNIDANKRYVRPEEVADYFGLQIEDILVVALAAGAKYKLPRTTLIHMERIKEFMKHLYKVPGTNKSVQKKYVRVGEGSVTYAIKDAPASYSFMRDISTDELQLYELCSECNELRTRTSVFRGAVQ